MKKAIWALCLFAASLCTTGCEDDFATVLNLQDDESAAPETPTPDEPAVDASAIKLGSYNLWISTKGTGDYLWTNRRTILAQSIVANGFDIFGFQEADETIKNELPVLVEQAGGRYEWWFFGRDSQNGAVGEACGIAWNPDRFELTEKHGFWLSETPDELSYGWDETAYHRIAVTAMVTDKVYKKKFFLMVTHGPLSATARAKAAELLVEREQLYNAGLPSVLVGDMNAAPDDAASVTLRSHWSDARKAAPAANIFGPVGTFQNHKTSTDLSDESRRIDYIYVRGDIELLSYRVDDSLIGGIYPSDHCPVSVQMKANYTPDEIEGSGTEAEPFLLNSVSDWNTIAAAMNNAKEDYPATASYRLVNDIDFTGKDLVSWEQFEGTLDGAGFALKGIAAANTTAERTFGPICTNEGTIRNLTVEATLSSVYKNFGGIVGTNRGVIDGAAFRGVLTGTAEASYIGGIAGLNTETGVVVNCANLGGSIDGKAATKAENCGGIVGGVTKGAYVINCYSRIDRIASSNNNIAGIVGFVGNDSFVINSYSTCAEIDANGTYCSAVGYSKIGNLQNIYGNAGCTTSKEGALVANDKKAGSVWKTTTGSLLTLEQMKSGPVTVGSSGEECADFAAALNAGGAIFDATTTETLATKPAVTLRKWTMTAEGPAFE